MSGSRDRSERGVAIRVLSGWLKRNGFESPSTEGQKRIDGTGSVSHNPVFIALQAAKRVSVIISRKDRTYEGPEAAGCESGRLQEAPCVVRMCQLQAAHLPFDGG